MRKISFVALVLAALMLVTSCGGATADEETTKAEDTVKETVTDQDESKIDFENAEIDGKLFAFLSEGDAPALDISDGKENFESSKPSVAEVDSEGNIIPKSSGVTLIGYERDGEAWAVVLCVVGEGEMVDRTSYGSAQTFEVGDTFMHTAPEGADRYETSDNSIVNIDNLPKLSFEKSGYAYIIVSNASRPFSYSFIVYDREVE